LGCEATIIGIITTTPGISEIPDAGTTIATTSVQGSDDARCGRRIRQCGTEDEAGVGAEAANKPASQNNDDVSIDDKISKRGWRTRRVTNLEVDRRSR
jgi:hypothetical protein